LEIEIKNRFLLQIYFPPSRDEQCRQRIIKLDTNDLVCNVQKMSLQQQQQQQQQQVVAIFLISRDKVIRADMTQSDVVAN
jgi:hypothetical protein